CGGYAGNVLFENFELVRSIKRSGGKELNADDLFVQRLPPHTRHFWSQRVRQAYDEFARPTRMAFFLSLLPVLVWCLIHRRWKMIVMCALTSIALGEVGRRRHGGARVYPLVSSFLAPVWLLERGICSWLAVYTRIFCGGILYGVSRLKYAAS
ncbi:MAG: glycosyltransferase family 2 protein, partial [Candidatus Eremiobacteraeota bacterium]|nr:glycosyltransferase family 2 protein [Candidatus Eremiobacteraeota bacterium]